MNTIDHVNEHFGRYTVIKLLASNGGYASVYLGEHTVLKTAPPVAIKILHNSLNSEDEKSSFIKEAHILAALQHKYILQIIDADPESGTGFPYIITEFAAKGSLRDRLNTHWQEPLPLEEALRILSQVGQALHHAHQKNIIHRDLKPENILFKSRDQALLADFGIAVVIEKSGPQFVGKTGTPAYMAPEQFKGLASRETDQYSLGCIAYELCTGRRPFKGSSFIHLSFLHATEQPVAPRQYNPQLPSRVEQAILKAMEKHEKDRHPTIIAFLEALGATIPETSRPAEQKKTLLAHKCFLATRYD